MLLCAVHSFPLPQDGIPVLIPDFFSGMGWNSTTNSFVFYGYGGTASAAVGGQPILNKPSYCFPRLADDILDSVGMVEAPTVEVSKASFRDFLGYSEGRKTRPTVRATALDADSECGSTPSPFPPIPVPSVDWATALHGAGKECIQGLFGSSGSPATFPGSGDASSVGGGIPMRLALPAGLFANNSAVLPDFLGPGHDLALNDLTIDLRQLPNAANDDTVYEGVFAANVSVDGIHMVVFVAGSTAPGDMSKCASPAPEEHVPLPPWLQPGAADDAAVVSSQPKATTSALGFVRMYYLDVAVLTDVLTLRGSLFGFNGACPLGRTMMANMTMALVLGETGDPERNKIQVTAALNLCNSTEDNPRWRVKSDVALSGIEVFGSELSVANASVFAFGYANGNATAWRVGIDGDAYNVFGLDYVGVHVRANSTNTNTKTTGVDAAATLAVNTTLYGSDSLKMAGSITYQSDQSAHGDVSADFDATYGKLSAAASFTKYAQLGNTGQPFTWQIMGDITKADFGPLLVRLSRCCATPPCFMHTLTSVAFRSRIVT